MRTIPIPDRDEDFTADPVELFFDLAYVFAFSQLVSLLVHDPTWHGVGQFAMLFTMLWLPWTQFTWSANAVAGNGRPVRLLFLIATVVSVPMAGSVSSAFGTGGAAFALSLAVILAIAFVTMRIGLHDEPEVLASLAAYSVPNAVGAILLVVGGFVDGDIRTWMWLAAILTVVAGTIRAGGREWLVRPAHFAERHGLIVIVALGELIVALGNPVVDQLGDGEGLSSKSLVALVAAGAFACLLWWAYFDRISPALEARNEQCTSSAERGRFARDVYTYLHQPLVAAVVLCAAGLEEMTLHPDAPVPTAFRWMMCAGLAGYLLSMVVAIWRSYSSIAIERLGLSAVLLVLAAVSGSLSGTALVIIIDVLLAVVLWFEHQRVEVKYRTADGS